MGKKTDIKILGLLFLFVFILEFWVSVNSYTHDLYNRVDSACFFLCGKAWMNGMIPYVDFSDSKGPLLWLIFGIGYLFSNYNYLGIFWIECIFYTVTFFYCYKIGFLFLKDTKTAFLCSVLMSLAFFCSAYHFETRAEDFCQPFIMGGLYYTLRVLYGFPKDKDITVASFAIGVGFAAALLIKFTIAAMIMIFFFALLWYLIQCRRDKIVKSFLYAFLGFFLVVFPFVLYFLLKGNFSDFIKEYFVATSQSVVKKFSLIRMIKEYLLMGWGNLLHLSILKSITICFLLVNIAGGCLFFYKKLPAFKLFPAIIALWFVCISMYHSMWLAYYYQSFSGFAIFPIIMYLTFFKRFTLKKLQLAVVTGAIAVIVIAENLLFSPRPNFFLNKTEERTDFYYVNLILSQVHNPKLMYSFIELGYGTPAHALPGYKYWFGWLGATDPMILGREWAIKNHLPDFIIILPAYDTDNHFEHIVQQSGYVKFYTWMTQELTVHYETYLYGKPGFSIPSRPDFHITPMDILLKKRIISVKAGN